MSKYVSKISVAAATGLVAVAMLGGAPVATAATAAPVGEGPQLLNWTSSMSQVGTGFQSRRWSDAGYSQVHFTKCNSQEDNSAHVDLRKDVTGLPDKSWGVKRYNACFGGGHSSGSWHNLERGKQFFQIKHIDDGVNVRYNKLDVRKVTVDTSASDS